MARRPVIGITMGDPAGIGPEIVLRALADRDALPPCRPVVIGDAWVLRKAADELDIAVSVSAYGDMETVDHGMSGIVCLDLQVADCGLLVGCPSAASGRAAYAYLAEAVRLALKGSIQAICTAPISKEALHMAGYRYPGHTEILAEMTGVRDYAMLLSAPNLKVIHVTTHMGLVDAVQSIKAARVLSVIELAHEVLARAVKAPRIAVCGVNPHAGEGGLFGCGEEENEIRPACERAQQMGINAIGPLPPDTVFFRAYRGEFDVVVAMYHDQGHIPVKLLGFEQGVNITVGLPIVRTSVDHGTAYDIVGRGIADPSSLQAAIRDAVTFSEQGNENTGKADTPSR